MSAWFLDSELSTYSKRYVHIPVYHDFDREKFNTSLTIYQNLYREEVRPSFKIYCSKTIILKFPIRNSIICICVCVVNYLLPLVPVN